MSQEKSHPDQIPHANTRHMYNCNFQAQMNVFNNYTKYKYINMKDDGIMAT